MSIKTGQSVTKIFETTGPTTGAAVNADSLPTGTLYQNGTANAASVTVTNVGTGIYKAQVTLPTLAQFDICDLSIAATVSSVSSNAVIWSDTADILFDSSGYVNADAQKIAGSTPGGTTMTALSFTGTYTNTPSFSSAVTVNTPDTTMVLSVDAPSDADVTIQVYGQPASGEAFHPLYFTTAIFATDTPTTNTLVTSFTVARNTTSQVVTLKFVAPMYAFKLYVNHNNVDGVGRTVTINGSI